MALNKGEKLERTISGLILDTSDLPAGGEIRSFEVLGDDGAMFGLEVYDDDGNYYDFYDSSWSTTKTRIKRAVIKGSKYTGSIDFSTPASKTTHVYNIMLFAESFGSVKTKHVTGVEIRNADGSVNLNASTGSNSALLKKTISQSTVLSLRISAIAPSRGDAITDTVDGAVVHGTNLVMDTSYLVKKIYIGDKVSGTNIAAGTTIAAVNVASTATRYTLSTAVSGTVADAATLTFTGPFDSMTPRYGTTTGSQSFAVSPGGNQSTKTNFSITLTAAAGRSFSIIRQPKQEDIAAVNLMNIGAAALAIDGEDTSSGALFYRWPVSNVAGFSNNMILDPSKTAVSTTIDSYITGYEATQTITTEKEVKYKEMFSEIIEERNSIITKKVKSIETTGSPTVSSLAIITAQAGNVIFNKQQVDALKDDTSIKVLAYNTKGIDRLTYGAKLEFTNLNVELAAVTTATSSAVTGSTNIPVDERAGIMNGQSMMTGIGINATDVKVVSGASGNTGAGTIVVSAEFEGGAQTIEDNQTLTFSGASNIATITGQVTVSQIPYTNPTVYFDVEKFLTCY